MPVTLIESLDVGMQVWTTPIARRTNLPGSTSADKATCSKGQPTGSVANDVLTAVRSYARQHPCIWLSAASHLYTTLLSLSGINLATTLLRHAGHGQSGPPCAQQACSICGQPGTAGWNKCTCAGRLHSYHGHTAAFRSASFPCRLFGGRFTSHKPRSAQRRGVNPRVGSLLSPVQPAASHKNAFALYQNYSFELVSFDTP